MTSNMVFHHHHHHHRHRRTLLSIATIGLTSMARGLRRQTVIAMAELMIIIMNIINTTTIKTRGIINSISKSIGDATCHPMVRTHFDGVRATTIICSTQAKMVQLAKSIVTNPQ